MGLFGFAANIVSATVKVALTPVAIVKDVVNVISSNEADDTKILVKSAGKDITKAIDELLP